MILKGWFLQFYERENDTAVICQENLQIQDWSREEVWFLVSGSILLLPPPPILDLVNQGWSKHPANVRNFPYLIC